MPARSRVALATVLSLVGCGLLAACGLAGGDTPPPRPPPPEPPPASCMPPGLDGTRAVEALALPPGCSLRDGGTEQAPRVLGTAEELARHLECASGESPAIDLAASDVLVVTQTLSPAHAGSEIRDDGTTITFVTRFRSPCPGDPMPMPMSSSFAFLLPKGAARAYRTATCSLPERC